METSAKTNSGISEAFQILSQHVLSQSIYSTVVHLPPRQAAVVDPSATIVGIDKVPIAALRNVATPPQPQQAPSQSKPTATHPPALTPAPEDITFSPILPLAQKFPSAPPTAPVTTQTTILPLFSAAWTGNFQEAKRLISEIDRFDVGIVSSHNKSSLLHAAAAGGSASLCELLIEKGANVNATDSQGDTPLQYWALAYTAAVLRKSDKVYMP